MPWLNGANGKITTSHIDTFIVFNKTIGVIRTTASRSVLFEGEIIIEIDVK